MVTVILPTHCRRKLRQAIFAFGQALQIPVTQVARTLGFVMDQPDSQAYLIVDEDHLQRPEFPLIKFIDGWETIRRLRQQGESLPVLVLTGAAACSSSPLATTDEMTRAERTIARAEQDRVGQYAASD